MSRPEAGEAGHLGRAPGPCLPTPGTQLPLSSGPVPTGDVGDPGQRQEAGLCPVSAITLLCHPETAPSTVWAADSSRGRPPCSREGPESSPTEALRVATACFPWKHPGTL